MPVSTDWSGRMPRGIQVRLATAAGLRSSRQCRCSTHNLFHILHLYMSSLCAKIQIRELKDSKDSKEPSRVGTLASQQVTTRARVHHPAMAGQEGPISAKLQSCRIYYCRSLTLAIWVNKTAVEQIQSMHEARKRRRYTLYLWQPQDFHLCSRAGDTLVFSGTPN